MSTIEQALADVIADTVLGALAKSTQQEIAQKLDTARKTAADTIVKQAEYRNVLLSKRRTTDSAPARAAWRVAVVAEKKALQDLETAVRAVGMRGAVASLIRERRTVVRRDAPSLVPPRLITQPQSTDVDSSVTTTINAFTVVVDISERVRARIVAVDRLLRELCDPMSDETRKELQPARDKAAKNREIIQKKINSFDGTSTDDLRTTYNNFDITEIQLDETIRRVCGPKMPTWYERIMSYFNLGSDTLGEETAFNTALDTGADTVLTAGLTPTQIVNITNRSNSNLATLVTQKTFDILKSITKSLHNALQSFQERTISWLQVIPKPLAKIVRAVGQWIYLHLFSWQCLLFITGLGLGIPILSYLVDNNASTVILFYRFASLWCTFNTTSTVLSLLAFGWVSSPNRIRDKITPLRLAGATIVFSVLLKIFCTVTGYTSRVLVTANDEFEQGRSVIMRLASESVCKVSSIVGVGDDSLCVPFFGNITRDDVLPQFTDATITFINDMAARMHMPAHHLYSQIQNAYFDPKTFRVVNTDAFNAMQQKIADASTSLIPNDYSAMKTFQLLLPNVRLQDMGYMARVVWRASDSPGETLVMGVAAETIASNELVQKITDAVVRLNVQQEALTAGALIALGVATGAWIPASLTYVTIKALQLGSENVDVSTTVIERAVSETPFPLDDISSTVYPPVTIITS